jgi:hypothetical protein
MRVPDSIIGGTVPGEKNIRERPDVEYIPRQAKLV